MVHFFQKNKKGKQAKASVQPKPRAAAAAAAGVILEAMIDGVAVVDMNGNIIQCNSAYAKMHGLKTLEETKGINLSGFVAERDLQRTMNGVKKTFETGTNINFEYVAKDKAGKEFPVLANASALKDEKGKIVGAIGVLRDITELKLLQEKDAAAAAAAAAAAEKIKREIAEKMSKGLEVKVKERTVELQDAVTRLQASEQQQKAANQQLNAANQQLGAAQKNLQDKLLELERFNKVAVGRELKMVELKEEIARLKTGAQKPAEINAEKRGKV